MPDTLNKQAIVNLLIDSPLREPIKINLIDIVNNTNEPDLPKVYSTIVKELEIFQKATERRMKLADETIAKIGGVAPAATPTTPASVTPPSPTLPPLDLPPLPVPPTPPPAAPSPSLPPLSVPPLDLPPLPAPSVVPDEVRPTLTPAPAPMAAPQPLGATPMAASSDEDALAEIQKELDSLKTATAAADVASAATPTPAPAPVA